MLDVPRKTLLADEFLAGAQGWVDGGRYETKLDGYFRVASLRHYLFVNPAKRRLIHHARDEAGTITTRILGDGPLRLDPPGIVLGGLCGPD